MPASATPYARRRHTRVDLLLRAPKMAAQTWTRAKMHASPLLPAPRRCARLGGYGASTESSRLRSSSHVLPRDQEQREARLGYKKSLSSIDKRPPPPGSVLVNLPKADSIPSSSSPPRFTFTAAVCETVPQGSSSPLCSIESTTRAEFSREGSNIEVGTRLDSGVPFRTSVHSLRSSSIDSQFKRTVGLDYSMIKIH